jgi:hypothetical protein
MTDAKQAGDGARWAKIIGITVAATLLGIYIYYPYSPGGSQQKNMKLAREHLPRVLPIISADSRFARVTAEEYTGNGGSLVLRGRVRAEQDLAELKRQVEATAPPVRVTWFVLVVPPELDDDNAGG